MTRTPGILGSVPGHDRMRRLVSKSLSLVTLVGAAACDSPRFPVCKSNEDCSDPDAGYAGTVCFNLKCVECRYDSDCDGGTCSGRNECERLDAPVATSDAGEEKVVWEHGSWDQCAAECKDKACIAECDAKFSR